MEPYAVHQMRGSSIDQTIQLDHRDGLDRGEYLGYSPWLMVHFQAMRMVYEGIELRTWRV